MLNGGVGYLRKYFRDCTKNTFDTHMNEMYTSLQDTPNVL